jgi:hypothetical protein
MPLNSLFKLKSINNSNDDATTTTTTMMMMINVFQIETHDETNENNNNKSIDAKCVEIE